MVLCQVYYYCKSATERLSTPHDRRTRNVQVDSLSTCSPVLHWTPIGHDALMVLDLSYLVRWSA